MPRLSCLILAHLLFLLSAAEPDMIGYRGDGSGVFSGPQPPTVCDPISGEGVRWRADLPNWGHGCPIVVGGKVLLTYEGGWGDHDFPVLCCLDMAKGTVLWEQELNHLQATGHAGATAPWAEQLAIFRTHYALFDRWSRGDKAAAEAAWQEMGYAFGGYKPGYGQLRSLKKKEKPDKSVSTVLKAAGLALETWQHNCGMGTSAFGQSFPTPVSDGRNVYVATAFASFFKFDLDGAIAWCVSDPAQLGEYCRNGRSPLLHDGLFISDVQGRVRAIDQQSGRILWAHEVPTETWMSPVIITVGGTDVLLTFQRKAFRLPDGAPLAVEGGTDFGALTVVKHDERDVTFHTGGGEHGGWTNKGNCDTPPPSAVRWSLQGERLTGEVLWSGLEGEKASSHTGLLYHQGKLYHHRNILEPLTGQVLKAGDKRNGMRSKHLFLANGDRIWTLDEQYNQKDPNGEAASGILRCYDLDGALQLEASLPVAGSSPQKQRQSVEQTGYQRWRFSYSCPFTIGEGCVLVRSYDHLWCIGR